MAKTFKYSKFIDRKGDHCILIDLKGYVKECIDNGLGVLGNKDYMMICPYCSGEAYKTDSSYEGKPYTKWKLYVDKSMQYGHCFRCDNRFVNDSDEIRYEFHIPEPPIAVEDYKLEKLDKLQLDKYYSYSETDELGIDYLVKKRHYLMRDLYKLLGIRFTQDHNPVIPFKFHNEFIYYQIKNAYGNVPYNAPYYSPHIDHKPAYIIEHGNNTDKFIICEGVFDAIACLIMYKDRIPFALLGSSITNYQIAMLRTYTPMDILVYLDSTSLSQKVAGKIGRYLDYATINIVESPYGQDPEEKLKQQIIMNNDL